jgi:hypothetical protein
LIPEEGQLVKVVIYGEAMYREYIGPHISSLENEKEGYVNTLSSHKFNYHKDLIKNGYVNSIEDFGILHNNSQVVLADKELFLRTNAQEYSGKKKNQKMALYQQSTFNTTLTVETTKKKVVQEPEKIISHLLEISVNKKFREFISERTIHANIKLVSLLDHKNQNGKLGVTNNTYNSANPYNDGEIELEYDIVTDDVSEIEKVIDQLKLNILDRKISDLATLTQNGVVYTTTVTTPGADITITDRRTMTRAHAEISDRKEVEVISFVIRFSPDQKLFETSTQALELLGVSAGFMQTNPKFYAKERGNLEGFNNLINRYFGNNTIESKLMNESPTVVETEQTNPKFDTKKDSYNIQASDKILMLSTQVTPNVISNDPKEYGLTQKQISELVDPTKAQTYSTIRGELLLSMMIKLIDLFLAHGHSTGNTVKDSLEQDTRNELSKMKEQLLVKVNPDLSGGPDILNQYIRLN